MISPTLKDDMHKIVPLAVLKEPEKPDLRIPPSTYGQHADSICTLCSATIDSLDLSQDSCRYFKRSKYKTGSYGIGVCFYDRSNSMCDKLTDTDGKELN